MVNVTVQQGNVAPDVSDIYGKPQLASHCSLESNKNKIGFLEGMDKNVRNQHKSNQ